MNTSWDWIFFFLPFVTVGGLFGLLYLITERKYKR